MKMVTRKIRISIIRATTISGDRPWCRIQAFRSPGMLVKLMKLENIIAAIRMVNSIAVVRAEGLPLFTLVSFAGH